MDYKSTLALVMVCLCLATLLVMEIHYPTAEILKQLGQ